MHQTVQGATVAAARSRFIRGSLGSVSSYSTYAIPFDISTKPYTAQRALILCSTATPMRSRTAGRMPWTQWAKWSNPRS